MTSNRIATFQLNCSIRRVCLANFRLIEIPNMEQGADVSPVKLLYYNFVVQLIEASPYDLSDSQHLRRHRVMVVSLAKK